MCLDIRNLNEATTNEDNWPLPNIKQVIKDIGRSGANYFAKLDLTTGFWQMALDESSTQYTAFMSSLGLFEFLRVVMGLKSASSHFQRTMSREVLNELIGSVCALYIDDLCIYATTEDELLKRIELVFKRLADKNISVNPDKCHFGMLETEFLGHLISADHIGMTPEKINSVIKTAQPTTVGELHHFLGLCNYFRDHVRNHSAIVHPLIRMTIAGATDNEIKYSKNRPLKWTTEGHAAFERITNIIAELPKLYHIKEDTSTYPVFLHTDASDYGVGAYLFQVVDGLECPIAFLSKTLSAEQKRWSTNEKEAFAIYYALFNLDHFLRDQIHHTH